MVKLIVVVLLVTASADPIFAADPAACPDTEITPCRDSGIRNPIEPRIPSPEPRAWLTAAVDREARRTMLSAPSTNREAQAAAPQGQSKRSWIRRHPKLIGALIGFGVGYGIGVLAGDDGIFDDFVAEFNGLVLGGIGAGIGASVGAVVDATK